MRQTGLWLCREALSQLHLSNKFGAYVATPFRDDVLLSPIYDRYQPVLRARVAYIVHDLPIFEFQHVL